MLANRATRLEVSQGPTYNFDDIFSSVDAMYQRDRQTDRHRAAAKTALTHSVAR